MEIDETIELKKSKNENAITIDILNLSMYNLQILNNNNKDIIATINNVFKQYALNTDFDKFLQKLYNKKLISKKIIRIIEYIDKIITNEKDIKYKSIKNNGNKKFNILSKILLYFIKNNINNKNHLLNKKLFKILIIFVYWGIIPVKNFIVIIDIFLDSAIYKITQEKQIINTMLSFKSSPLYFLSNLFKALTSIPRKYINNEIHLYLIDELIEMLDKSVFSYPYNLEVNKLPIWLTLLGNKITSLELKSSPLYAKLISLMVQIYKYSFENNFFVKEFYRKSAISFDYYINSLDFLTALFKEEEKYRTNNKFKIKNGFYVYNNMPLTLNRIKFKSKSYSLIFSFRLTKMPNNKNDIILFNLENSEQKKIILRFVINGHGKTLKIVDAKNSEWNENIQINSNQNYLICLSQEDKLIGKSIDLFINNDQEKKGFNSYNNSSIAYPVFDQNMTFELGKSNFEGIFGEVLFINKNIKSEYIHHLYNLKENYSDILCSLNYKNDFTSKKYIYTNNKEDITFFQNLKFQSIFKILTSEIHSLLKQDSNGNTNIIINPFGQLKYDINDNSDNVHMINSSIRIYRLNYSVENFFNYHGLDYLIFQLHRIISLSESNEEFNYYFYKTLSFILEYIKFGRDYIFPKKDNKVKTEKKYINLKLSLLTVLNAKKRILKLDEKIRDILLEMSKEYSKKKAAVICQKINFSIVLDNNLFKKSNVKYYEKLFDILHNYLTNDDKDNSLLNKEIFYKFLVLDYVLESTEIKHKKFMEILSYFLIREDKNKKKEINSMNKTFINYFIEIKKPKKIYHYLKFIYLNINLIKPFYEGNEKFLHYVSNNSTYNNLDNNKYKDYKDYVGYNQILCFLLNELFQKKEPKIIDTLSSLDNIKNPDYKFIKCLFIQHFSIDNKIKLKFIKPSKRKENEIIILKHLLGQRLNLLSNVNIFDYNNFLNKLNILLNYYFDIYEIYELNKDLNINKEKLLKDSIKLIVDFFEEISERKELKNITTYKNLSADNINKKKEKKNPVDKNKNKESSIIKFINELFCSSSIKLLFTLYFNLYLENEFKDTKFTKYITISIDKIYNPFYFYLLLPSTNSGVDITINNSYKEKILEIIIDEIISINKNIKNRIETNKTFAQNSIILLIRIYQMNIDNSMNVELEKKIMSYLKYFLVNWYGYSKYIFDINLLDNNIINKKEEDNLNKSNNSIKEKKRKESKLSTNSINEKKVKENKFLLEIVLDIFFSFLVKSKNSDLINFFNDNLKIKENKSIFYTIDEFFFMELNDNMDHSYKYQMIRLLNSPQITTKYCNGANSSNIIYTIYFLIYFINKLSFFNVYFRINEVNETKQSEITNLLNKALEAVFKDNLNLFKIYLKKIRKPKTRNKSNSNEILFKSYDFIFEYLSTKNKDDSLKFDKGKSIFEHFEKILQNLKKWDDSETKTASNSNFSLSLFIS